MHWLQIDDFFRLHYQSRSSGVHKAANPYCEDLYTFSQIHQTRLIWFGIRIQVPRDNFMYVNTYALTNLHFIYHRTIILLNQSVSFESVEEPNATVAYLSYSMCWMVSMCYLRSIVGVSRDNGHIGKWRIELLATLWTVLNILPPPTPTSLNSRARHIDSILI